MMGPTTRRDVEQLAANLLRDARQQTGTTRADLAARAQVPLDVIDSIESGQVQPDLVTLIELLAALDLGLRTRLEAYDDHDDVLDATYAAMTPQQQAVTDARHDAMVAAFTAAGRR